MRLENLRTRLRQEKEKEKKKKKPNARIKKDKSDLIWN
jgi:hypothetical protein